MTRRTLLLCVATALGAPAVGCSLIIDTDGLSGGSAKLTTDDAGRGTVDAGTATDASAPPPPDTGLSPPADAAVTSDSALPSPTDGSADVADAKPSVCSTGGARVFLTLTTFDGNLGGVSGGDQKCQTSAIAAGLGGSWRAWLSDSVTPAITHIKLVSGPYVLLDGTVIAASSAALLAGTLAHAIDRTEQNAPRPDGNTEVWTGYDVTGAGGGGYCTGASDWESDDASASTPLVGHSDATDSTWSAAYLQDCNRTNVRLYCFEECP